MFRTVYRLPFTLLGIPVQLDVTFLFVLPFLAWIIGSDIRNYIQLFDLEVNAATLQQGWMPYILGFIAAVGLFVSVVVHELGHSVVGQQYGLKIKAITLWILGGMAQFEKMPRQRGAEAVMAIAGPVTSYAIAAACWAGLRYTPADLPALKFILAYLMWMNVVLATFNLLPALPLDGGRVLRSLLALRMSYLRATQISAGISKVLAVLMGLFGFMVLNIFLMLIAFFIYMGVSGESQIATVGEVLRGIAVRDLMTREVETVPPNLPVSQLLQKMLEKRHLAYPVVSESGEMVGMVTLGHVRNEQQRPSDSTTTVQQIMSQKVPRISENESALEGFERISSTELGRLVVVDSSGRLKGIISKTDLIRAIQVRMVGEALQGRAPG